jgi:hypothetical protein
MNRGAPRETPVAIVRFVFMLGISPERSDQADRHGTAGSATDSSCQEMDARNITISLILCLLAFFHGSLVKTKRTWPRIFSCGVPLWLFRTEISRNIKRRVCVCAHEKRSARKTEGRCKLTHRLFTSSVKESPRNFLWNLFSGPRHFSVVLVISLSLLNFFFRFSHFSFFYFSLFLQFVLRFSSLIIFFLSFSFFLFSLSPFYILFLYSSVVISFSWVSIFTFSQLYAHFSNCSSLGSYPFLFLQMFCIFCLLYSFPFFVNFFRHVFLPVLVIYFLALFPSSSLFIPFLFRVSFLLLCFRVTFPLFLHLSLFPSLVILSFPIFLS